jgi:hypothetical protein
MNERGATSGRRRAAAALRHGQRGAWLHWHQRRRGALFAARRGRAAFSTMRYLTMSRTTFAGRGFSASNRIVPLLVL